MLSKAINNNTLLCSKARKCKTKEKKMKTLKFVPILMAAMLLSACNTGGSKVKVSEPKFAKENGTEMTADDFLKEFVTIEGYNVTPDGPAIKDSEFFKEDAKVGSKEMKVKYSSAYTVTLTREEKEIEKSENLGVTEATAQADANNKVAKTVTTSKTSTSSKTQEGKGSGSSSYKSTTYMQEGKVDDKNGVIEASVEKKVYDLDAAFDTEEPRTYTSDTWFNIELQGAGQSLGSGFIEDIVMIKIMGGELTGFKFFKNDKVYTITYSHEETETLKYQQLNPSTMALEDVEYATRTTKEEVKRQFDITEGKWKYLTSSVETVETKYLKDRNNNLVGDVTLSKTEAYSETTLNSKDVKVKALDVSGYKVLH